MTVTDGRVAAWTYAWTCVEAAQKVRAEADKLPENPLNLDLQHLHNKRYEQLLAEARIFVALTGVGDLVGIGAGEWLLQKAEQERRGRGEMASFLEHFKSKGESDDGTD